jgi:hypothetical protein
MNNRRELPELTQQPVLFLDGTPDKDYPLRILRAYRQQCDCRWTSSVDGSEPENPLLMLMNEHCEQRAKILDRAIAILEGVKDERD